MGRGRAAHRGWHRADDSTEARDLRSGEADAGSDQGGYLSVRIRDHREYGGASRRSLADTSAARLPLALGAHATRFVHKEIDRMRKKVTVVGGGFVGSTTAQRIVDMDLADVV